MADENPVPRVTLADEAVAGYLAVLADDGVLLDFHERADSDPAPIVQP
jgi:hypothetical protein